MLARTHRLFTSSSTPRPSSLRLMSTSPSTSSNANPTTTSNPSLSEYPRTLAYLQTNAQTLSLLHASQISSSPKIISLAPMMEYTDSHLRFLTRLISKRMTLYTEMVTSMALVHTYHGDKVDGNGRFISPVDIAKGEVAGSVKVVAAPVVANEEVDDSSYLDNDNSDDDDSNDADEETSLLSTVKITRAGHSSYTSKLLASSPLLTPPTSTEGDSILQLGGSTPLELALAIKILRINWEKYRFTGVNLNCGCPSKKVSGKGCFGAALMRDPVRVRNCVDAMESEAKRVYNNDELFDADTDTKLNVEEYSRIPTLPISVKCRIGVDENATYDNLSSFIETTAATTTCKTYQVHARAAILSKNFSPADNRQIPPLDYPLVYKIANTYSPDNGYKIELNGGVNSILQAVNHYTQCNNLSGIMVGRGVVANSWYWSMVDYIIYGDELNSSGVKNRRDLVIAYGVHADGEEESKGLEARRVVVRCLSGLFNGEKNGVKWRREIDKIMSSSRPYGKRGVMENVKLMTKSKKVLFNEKMNERGNNDKYIKQKELGRTVLEYSEMKCSEALVIALSLLEDEVVDRGRLETFELMLLKTELVGIEREKKGLDKDEGDVSKNLAGNTIEKASVGKKGVKVKKVVEGLGGIHDLDGVAAQAIRIWNEERRLNKERISKMREEEGGGEGEGEECETCGDDDVDELEVSEKEVKKMG